jgi:hypothetical protein
MDDIIGMVAQKRVAVAHHAYQFVAVGLDELG